MMQVDLTLKSSFVCEHLVTGELRSDLGSGGWEGQAWINSLFELWIFDHTCPIFSFNLNLRGVKKRDEAAVCKVPKPDEGCSRGALVTTEGVDGSGLDP